LKSSSSQSLIIAYPCEQRRRSASRLRSRAVKLNGIRTSTCCRHEDLENLVFSNADGPHCLTTLDFTKLPAAYDPI
jgi:hypothetical protein